MDKSIQQVNLEHKIAELESLIDNAQQLQIPLSTVRALSEFEMIFNNSAIGIVYLMENRNIYRVNQRFCDLFNSTAEEIIGKTTQFIHVSEDSFTNFANQYFPKLSNGEIIKTEYRFRKASGEIVWCSLWGKAISPPQLDKGVIWILDDITERKQLEHLKEDVERMMHHDLKNPLGNIMMLLYLLKSSPNLNDQEKQYLDFIGKSGEEIKRLIDIPLDLFNMEIGKYKLDLEAVNLVEVLKKTSFNQSPAGSAGTASTVKIFINGKEANDDDSVNVNAEEHLCFNMFCNLLANAKEASKKDELISIYITTNNSIDITIHNQAAVPEKIRPHFFEKYSTEGKRKGTGLGTYSAKLIAETQGATISMQTSEEDGTRITVSFPKSASSIVP